MTKSSVRIILYCLAEQKRYHYEIAFILEPFDQSSYKNGVSLLYEFQQMSAICSCASLST